MIDWRKPRGTYGGALSQQIRKKFPRKSSNELFVLRRIFSSTSKVFQFIFANLYQKFSRRGPAKATLEEDAQPEKCFRGCSSISLVFFPCGAFHPHLISASLIECLVVLFARFSPEQLKWAAASRWVLLQRRRRSIIQDEKLKEHENKLLERTNQYVKPSISSPRELLGPM